ncbi:MAG: C39 family peptidase [bacterium]
MKKKIALFLMALALFLVYANNVFSEKLDVPFLSQAYPGEPHYIGQWGPATKNCGPVSVIMAVSYHLGVAPEPQNIKTLNNWMVEEGIIDSVDGYNGDYTDVIDLKKIATEYYEFPCVIVKQENDIDFLRKEIAAGNPVIVGVTIDMSATGSKHFMVITEVTDSGVIVNDPGHSEATTLDNDLRNKIRTFSQFQTSWSKNGYASVVITKAGRFADGIHDGSSEAIAQAYIIHGGASTFGKAWDNGGGVWTHSWPDNSSDPDAIYLQDFLNGDHWWVIAYNKFECEAFPIHGRILDKWMSDTGYANYGPPVECEKYWNAQNGHKIVYQHFTNIKKFF